MMINRLGEHIDHQFPDIGVLVLSYDVGDG
jgi:hypothetical protein